MPLDMVKKPPRKRITRGQARSVKVEGLGSLPDWVPRSHKPVCLLCQIQGLDSASRSLAG